MEEEKKSLNFIEQIIENDLENGFPKNKLRFRFPPEPNGYLHIGHTKAICINFGLGEKYGAPVNLRFDDTNPEKEEQEFVDSIKKDVEWLESRIDEYLPQLPELKHFIIPGGSKIAAEFHILRTFTRKLERRIVALIETEEHVNEIGLRYINRLSDYFFTAACLINVRMGVTETDYLRSEVIFK